MTGCVEGVEGDRVWSVVWEGGVTGRCGREVWNGEGKRN